jgi:AcrR family transcriptional regulator
MEHTGQTSRKSRDLGRDEWLRAARLALLRGGVEDVRVERLARDLRVTKGSFYWHFTDREELLELLLSEWEKELPEIAAQLKGLRGRAALERLLQVLEERVRLSEKGMGPSDAAIFTWASVAPRVARRVNRAEQDRMWLVRKLMSDSGRAELVYLTWLGFVARGLRVPESRKRFPQIARAMLGLLGRGERTK